MLKGSRRAATGKVHPVGCSVVAVFVSVNIPSSVGVAVIFEEVEPVLFMARLSHGLQIDHGPPHDGVCGEQPRLLVHDGNLELREDGKISIEMGTWQHCFILQCCPVFTSK